MGTLRSLLAEKTLKREYGVVLMSLLGYKVYEGDAAMVDTLIEPTLLYITAAAGLHIGRDKLRE